MDLVKIGSFLQKLRKEKGITQEQLAEQLGVARRTVSRWEAGSNMPDLDVLVELSDFYAVDLREILNGERKSEHMNEELKETVLQVADYSSEERARLVRRILVWISSLSFLSWPAFWSSFSCFSSFLQIRCSSGPEREIPFLKCAPVTSPATAREISSYSSANSATHLSRYA